MDPSLLLRSASASIMAPPSLSFIIRQIIVPDTHPSRFIFTQESSVDASSKDFFEALLTTPGVSGYEEPVQAVVRDYASTFADDVRTDIHGNVVVTCNADAELRVMFAGHCDQLGLLVSHISEQGFLHFQTVGGWDPQQLVGQRVTVWSDDGPVVGIISRKAIHLLESDERKKVVAVKDLWIDIGASGEEDARSVIRIGDPVTPALGFQELRNGLVHGPAMDDRTGVWVVVEAARRASQRGPGCAVHAVSTVQEEIGKRGATTSAWGIDPHVGIAVDVTHATDTPSVDQRQLGTVKLGAGPVVSRGPNINPRVGERLRELAAEHEIPIQEVALARPAANDANAIQVTRGGVAAGLVQIPNRYMHSVVETVAWSDLDHAADLLAAFAVLGGSPEEFVP